MDAPQDTEKVPVFSLQKKTKTKTGTLSHQSPARPLHWQLVEMTTSFKGRPSKELRKWGSFASQRSLENNGGLSHFEIRALLWKLTITTDSCATILPCINFPLTKNHQPLALTYSWPSSCNLSTFPIGQAEDDKRKEGGRWDRLQETQWSQCPEFLYQKVSFRARPLEEHPGNKMGQLSV